MESENYAPLMEMIISPCVTYLDFSSEGHERTEGREECSVQSSCNILMDLSHNSHQRALASTQGNRGREGDTEDSEFKPNYPDCSMLSSTLQTYAI